MTGFGLATSFIINSHLILPRIYYVIFGASKEVEAKDLYGNSVHTVRIIYLLKYRFQAYLPNLEIHDNGKMYYDFNNNDTFMKQGYYEYGTT